MQAFVVFVKQHWGLWLSFVVLLLSFLALEIKARRDRRAVSPQNAVLLMNREQAQVFDLRDEDLYQQGHIKGAKLVIFNELMKNPESLNSDISVNSPFILVCQSGQQSAIVANQLRRHGFTGGHVLEGGMRAWKHANMPVDKLGSE